MEKSIITSGKTIDLAIESALSQLGLDRDSVSVTVLQQAKSGFLGIGSCCRASVAIYNTPEDVDALLENLENVRKVMGL